MRPQVFYDEVPFGETSWSGKYLPQTGNVLTSVSNAGSNNSLAGGDINSVDHWDSTYKSDGYAARFLDVYAYGSFDLDGKNLEVRAGRQVVGWGEALMLQGGIAFAQNRMDASAATAPGVELKEIFLPTGALYASFGASESVTLEAYWQYEWIPSSLFPTGSFFSMQDFINGDRFIAGPFNDGVGFSRNEHDPSNNKQFGLGMRYLLGEGTEAAVYIVNYTDKYPMFWAANGAAEQGLKPAYRASTLRSNPKCCLRPRRGSQEPRPTARMFRRTRWCCLTISLRRESPWTDRGRASPPGSGRRVPRTSRW